MLFILRSEAFERNCRAVELTPDHVPDINVITGVLKGKNEYKNQQVAGIIIFLTFVRYRLFARIARAIIHTMLIPNDS